MRFKKTLLTLPLLALCANVYAMENNKDNFDWKNKPSVLSKLMNEKFDNFTQYIKENKLDPISDDQKKVMDQTINVFFKIPTSYTYPKACDYNAVLENMKFEGNPSYTENHMKYFQQISSFWNEDYSSKKREDITQDARLVVSLIYKLNPSNDELNQAQTIVGFDDLRRVYKDQYSSAFLPTFVEIYFNKNQYKKKLLANHVLTEGNFDQGGTVSFNPSSSATTTASVIEEKTEEKNNANTTPITSFNVKGKGGTQIDLGQLFSALGLNLNQNNQRNVTLNGPGGTLNLTNIAESLGYTNPTVNEDGNLHFDKKN